MLFNAHSKFSVLFPLLALNLAVIAVAAASPTVSYPQPAPSNQEQYLLELINAARANPVAEGQMLAGISDPEILRYYSYYKVSTAKLASDFNGYAAKPPLAFNTLLMAAARNQSVYQATAGVQSHNSADGTTFDKRVSATGYQWSGLGENVYAYAENAFFGHVGLMADWGVPSLDHRQNMMNSASAYPTYREIGISCVPSSITNFGPLVITQDFGTPADAGVAYLTGVVYQDSNGDGAYSEGEGLGGVTVTPDSGTAYAVTSASGGFIIPLPTSGAGTLTITASGGGLGAARTRTVAYTAGTNVKVDFTTADPSGPSLPTVSLTVKAKDAVVYGQSGKVVIKRQGDNSAPLTVSLGYAGTAAVGVDYAPLPATVTFAPGVSSIKLPVQATNPTLDTKVKVKVILQNQTGYAVSADPAGAKGSVVIWPAQ